MLLPMKIDEKNQEVCRMSDNEKRKIYAAGQDRKSAGQTDRQRAARRTPPSMKSREEAARTTEKHLTQKDSRSAEIVISGQGSAIINTGKKNKPVRSKPVVRTIRSKTKSPFPFSTMFFALICTLLVMFMIIDYVQINEYTQDISDMKSNLTALQSEEKDLTLELEKKNDLRQIEAYAEKNLGMVSSDQLLKVYVNTENEDKIDNYENEDEDYGVIATVMNALGENLKSYWNIFVKSE